MACLIETPSKGLKTDVSKRVSRDDIFQNTLRLSTRFGVSFLLSNFELQLQTCLRHYLIAWYPAAEVSIATVLASLL
jgi:hypothetical protein